MSSHGARVDIQSPLENKRLNLIPVGRQLQRTPPNKTPKSQASHLAEGPAIMDEEDPQDDTTCPPVEEERKSYRRSSITPASVNMGNTDPEAFVQGMQGYQWTDTDLEFVYQAKQQKQAQQLKQELSEVEKTLQAETQRLEMAVASRENLQSELSKVMKLSKTQTSTLMPLCLSVIYSHIVVLLNHVLQTLSCDLLLQLCKSVLYRSRTPDQLEGLGDKALLTMLNIQDIQQAVHEEKAQISSLSREAQELREKEEKAMEEMDAWQKKISILQENVDALKVELIALKTQLSEKEALMVSQVPAKGSKASRRAKPSTKTLREEVFSATAEQDTAEEGKTAPKEKAPKKTTSKKTSKKNTSSEEMAPNETHAQVKTPVETDPKKKPRTVKFSNVGEVHEKGQKGSRMAKTSTMASKDQKKTALTESKENETVTLETTDKEMAEKGKPAPKKKALKNTTSKKTAKKDLEVLQEKSPEEAATDKTAPEETVPEELAPKVKARVLEKGCKGSRTAKPSTTMVTEEFLKKTALSKRVEKQTAQIETDEKSKTARKMRRPHK
ncbi:cylicin-1 [Hemibagrus wyckioides]|uniref:cylicin-1 n=1 Tax=Hemibagrus wyckioides TaxID=337641 RepID=UPI00266D1EE4|nr:cylicin-1 [Hemibagrus wyckioides]